MFRGLDLRRVLFVDNQLFAFAANLKNGIPVVDFTGKRDDKELLKIAKYVKSISQEPDLMQVNERTFCLQKIINSNIEQFIKYYSFDELSEYSETDFEDDGITAKSGSQIPQALSPD